MRLMWETPFDKPHIVSEFGAEAVVGLHADSMTVWSEEYQASLYRNQLAMFDRIPFLAELSPWILKDFRSPRRLNPDYQQYLNKKGLISNDGQRRQSFHIMKDY
jgi:beta-glucuronidase